MSCVRARARACSNGDQPRGTQIVGNFIHEVGVWGKQGCGVFQALTMQTNLSHNIIFVSAPVLMIAGVVRPVVETPLLKTVRCQLTDSSHSNSCCYRIERTARGRAVERWDGRRQ